MIGLYVTMAEMPRTQQDGLLTLRPAGRFLKMIQKPSKYFSASIAAIHPLPAAVIA